MLLANVSIMREIFKFRHVLVTFRHYSLPITDNPSADGATYLADPHMQRQNAPCSGRSCRTPQNIKIPGKIHISRDTRACLDRKA